MTLGTTRVLDSSDLCYYDLQKFLNDNYIQPEGTRRIDYSISYLKWILKDCKCICMLDCANGLIGFVSLWSIKMILNGYTANGVPSDPFDVEYANVLCIRDDYRKKNLIHVLTSEIKRVASSYVGMFSVRYIVNQNMFSISTIYHKTLSNNDFIPNSNLRELLVTDLQQVITTWNSKCSSTFKISQYLTIKDVERLLDRPCYSYTDGCNFGAFYTTSFNDDSKVATLYYYSSLCIIPQLLHKIFQLGITSVNCTCLMGNQELLSSPFNFSLGSGILYNYFYGCSMKYFEPNEVGLVLV